MIDWLGGAFVAAQAWLFEGLVQPLLFAAGLMGYSEPAFDALEWLLIGAIEVALLAAVFVPLERSRGLEPVVDPRAVRVDVLYTLLHRLGGFTLFAFALLTPAVDALEAQLRLLGFSRLNIDQVWPGLTDVPVVSLLIYLVVLDFVDYWVHRAQHRVGWWWALHALHHSQRQMTFWCDNRNHLLDDLIRDALMAIVAVLIGVAPAQFVLLVVITRVMQSVQHANLRWRWGGPFERLIVSPSFHRLHHAIGHGHEGPARGCNFAVLFPVWDQLFGTADWRPGFVPTGVSDQLAGADYGRGFWMQQWLGLRRLARRGRAPGGAPGR